MNAKKRGSNIHSAKLGNTQKDLFRLLQLKATYWLKIVFLLIVISIMVNRFSNWWYYLDELVTAISWLIVYSMIVSKALDESRSKWIVLMASCIIAWTSLNVVRSVISTSIRIRHQHHWQIAQNEIFDLFEHYSFFNWIILGIIFIVTFVSIVCNLNRK